MAENCYPVTHSVGRHASPPRVFIRTNRKSELEEDGRFDLVTMMSTTASVRFRHSQLYGYHLNSGRGDATVQNAGIVVYVVYSMIVIP